MLDNNVIATAETPVALTNSPQTVNGNATIPEMCIRDRSDIFDTLKERGVQKIGLMVADGIKGLDVVVVLIWKKETFGFNGRSGVSMAKSLRCR